jgi:hypothetical protein
MTDGLAVPAESRPQRVICVLGMHRSGTSCLAGSLEQQGLFLGEVNTAAPWNKRGNRERFDVMNLQEDVLRVSGGSWDRPPSPVEWAPEHYEGARTILAEHAGAPVWGFKDPRTVLTLEGWERLVPDLDAVAIFRHPLRVARSLQSRNEMPIAAGLALWKAYNDRLLDAHRRRPFPIVSFDDEPGVLEAKLRDAGDALGLDPPSSAEAFFTDELRNAPAEGDSVPPEIEEVYDTLRRLAL